jgi:hypothetical protein
VHPILEAKHFAFGLQPLTRPNASAIADGVANGSPWQVPAVDFWGVLGREKSQLLWKIIMRNHENG